MCGVLGVEVREWELAEGHGHCGSKGRVMVWEEAAGGLQRMW